MKASEVLSKLGVSRVTLMNYVKKGKLVVIKKENGQYDYDENSVCKLLNCDIYKHDAIYARVSTSGQKNDLVSQIKLLENYCKEKKISGYKIYSEIKSGISFERDKFKDLINNVINNKIRNIYITNKDRLTRLSFITLEEIFKKFNVKIIVINEKHKSEDEEIMGELISMMYYFGSKIYSKRRKTQKDKNKEIS
jgi:putative resolvase